MTRLFIEQPLALPGSAKYLSLSLLNMNTNIFGSHVEYEYK